MPYMQHVLLIASDVHLIDPVMLKCSFHCFSKVDMLAMQGSNKIHEQSNTGMHLASSSIDESD